MSKELAKKHLKDEGGATILMALLALLVVAMVSTVILSAATSTVRQNKADQELQQNLLDLQSAGEYTRSALDNFTVTAETVSDDNVKWSLTGITSSSSDKPYSKALTDAVKEVYWPSSNAALVSTSMPRSFTLDFSYPTSDNSEAQNRSVKSSFVLKKDENNVSQFTLVFTFEAGSNSGQPDVAGKGQVLYLTLNGSETSSTSIDYDENTNKPRKWTTTYTYKCTGTSTFATSETNGGDR